MTELTNFSEDFERESQKDLVYLLETQRLLEEEIMKEEQRKPAVIQLIDPDKIIKKDEDKSEVLPF